MNNIQPTVTIDNAVKILNKEGIIIYPTESVFGFGCDPDSAKAVNYLLKIKRRSIKKGLILIAADYMQLKPYINDKILSQKQLNYIFRSWPGPTTFVLPMNISTPRWLTGCFNSIAVRVTNHPLVIECCRVFGKPIVSTSANFSGQSPCRTLQEVKIKFDKQFPILEGQIGGLNKPSEIRDIITGKCLRYG